MTAALQQNWHELPSRWRAGESTGELKGCGNRCLQEVSEAPEMHGQG